MVHKIEADGILLEFDSRRILGDVYLKCETGSIVGLLGRNGEGKSSLLNIIYGTLKPQSGSIRIDDYPYLEPYKTLGLLHYLPQFNFIPKSKTLKSIFSDFNLDYSEFQNLFEEFKLRLSARFENISGGQKRLVEVYILLVSDSKFVLLDEPFSHLSPLYIEKIKVIIEEQKKNKGIIVTDHLYSHVLEISDSLYLLNEGKTYVINSKEEMKLLGYANLKSLDSLEIEYLLSW